MPLDRSDILRRTFRLSALSCEFSCRISRPATSKQIAWRQKQVERPIPQSILDLASHTGSRIEIQWQLDPRLGDRSDYEDVFPSSGGFEFNFFETDLRLLDGWEHSFTHWKEYRDSPNPFGFDELFPMFGLPNGDLIVEIIGGSARGSIYYLDHEGGSGNWKHLADSYDSFLSVLAALWFPRLDWHDSLDRFYDHELRKLSLDLPVSRRWNSFITSDRS